MDIDISQKEKTKRNNNYIVYSLLSLFVLAISIWSFRQLLAGSISKENIRIAKAEIGSIENTLTASGEVLPEYEQIIVSPLSATLLKTLYEPGNSVKWGATIIELDEEENKLNIEKQTDQLTLKKNEISQLKLKLSKDLFDLKIKDTIKAMNILSLKADLENAKRLEKAGGGTKEAVETATMSLRVAEIEKKQIENDIRNKEQTIGLEIQESELNATIKEKDLFEFRNQLKKSKISAPRNGVLTYINKNIGAKITEGEVLARLADLHSYKVMGYISDTYADQIKIGMPAIIKINDQQIRASISNIEPSVQNNILSFELTLNEKEHELLRPKLKVEVFLITTSHEKTLRVPNGPAFKGISTQDIFVINAAGNAERRIIKIGLTNFDFVEILQGISEGESVIISDMSQYKKGSEIKIK